MFLSHCALQVLFLAVIHIYISHLYLGLLPMMQYLWWNWSLFSSMEFWAVIWLFLKCLYLKKNLSEDTTAAKQCCLEDIFACKKSTLQSHFICKHGRNLHIFGKNKSHRICLIIRRILNSFSESSVKKNISWVFFSNVKWITCTDTERTQGIPPLLFSV